MLTPDARIKWNQQAGQRWLSWDCLPPTEYLSSIESLRLRTVDSTKPFPKAVGKLPRLKYLSMPLQYADVLSDDWFPPTIETLSFNENTDSTSKGSIQSKVVFPSVKRVECGTGYLYFRQDNFPCLSDISLRFDSRRKIVDQLLRYNCLEYVFVGPISNQEDLQLLSRLHPIYLGLSSGNLITLKPLEQFENVEHLWLHSLNKLTDITAIGTMPLLRSVEMLYCTRVEDLRPLLLAKRLQSLSIVQCKNIQLAAVADDLIALGLEELSISGDKHLYERDGKWITNAK